MCLKVIGSTMQTKIILQDKLSEKQNLLFRLELEFSLSMARASNTSKSLLLTRTILFNVPIAFGTVG